MLLQCTHLTMLLFSVGTNSHTKKLAKDESEDSIAQESALLYHAFLSAKDLGYPGNVHQSAQHNLAHTHDDFRSLSITSSSLPVLLLPGFRHCMFQRCPVAALEICLQTLTLRLPGCLCGRAACILQGKQICAGVCCLLASSSTT